VQETLPVVESYRAHNIVFHDHTWFAISEGYRSLTKGRIERRGYRRLVAAGSLEDAKRILDRMPYPKLLLHARIVVHRVRTALRNLFLRASGLGHRVLRAFGFRAQRIAGKSARMLVGALQRRGRSHPAEGKNGRMHGGT
jgi:hypothetical protein